MSISAANKEAVARIQKGTARLTGIALAKNIVPGLTDRMLLHAGPPVKWENMCGTMRGAMIGAMLFEGWAKNPEEAASLAASGKIAFDSAHHHGAIGPMSGIISPERNCDFHALSYSFSLIPSNSAIAALPPLYALTTLCPV